MVETFNSPNIGYVVQMQNEQGEALCHFVIGQFIEKPNDEKALRKNRNAVEGQLDLHHRKTGCNYLIVWEGPHELAQAGLPLLATKGS